MTIDAARAIAVEAGFTVVDAALDSVGRPVLWVVDDVAYATVVNRLRKRGAWPVLTMSDPRRRGLLGMIVQELKHVG